MKIVETLVLGIEDFFKGRENIPFNKIEYSDFKISGELFHSTDIVIFIDDDGKHKFLKNRHSNIIDGGKTVDELINENLVDGTLDIVTVANEIFNRECALALIKSGASIKHI